MKTETFTTAMQAAPTPGINLNGTSPRDLQDQKIAVIQKLDQTIEALSQAIPHGRDYQTFRTTDEYLRAREVHVARMRMLSTLQEIITAEALAIGDDR